jgi:geranylgeranyl pyrophosphate synthase
MNPEKSLVLKKALIDKDLDRLLPARGSRLRRAIRYAVLPGGKRFRPLLVMASGACFGARRAVLRPFACALELIHCYSLVHDDLPAMDNDELRRGKPTCHKAFGEDVAILAGDSLLTLAFEVMAAAPVPAALLAAKQAAILAVSRCAGVEGLIGGQWLDLSLSRKKLTRGQQDTVMSLKTGALIHGAVEVGALLGRADAAGRRAISKYGKALGLAFQVRDDIMDSVAGPATPRPDHTALYGLAGSRARLARLVEDAVASVARFGERAAELRYLALALLDEAGNA